MVPGSDSAGQPSAARVNIYGVTSTCLIDDDVLSVNTGVASAVASSYYQNAGLPTDPQEAGVFAGVAAGHPHISLIDGFRIQSIGSRYTLSRGGLLKLHDERLQHRLRRRCAR